MKGCLSGRLADMLPEEVVRRCVNVRQIWNTCHRLGRLSPELWDGDVPS